MTLFDSSWWIPFYGLVGAVLTLPWASGLNKRTGPRPGAYFNLLMTILAWIHCVFLFQETLGQAPRIITFNWVQLGDLQINLTLGIDAISVGSAVLVTTLSFFAQFFALAYMEKDWGMARFFSLLGFFEGAMCGLVLSDSLILSYGLLELLTLSTYLLVGFWYAQPLVVTAARDAFWTKRAGDLMLLMGVVALSTLTPSLNFTDLQQWAVTTGKTLDPLYLNVLCLALIAGPIGKCAQFPLNLWLDEAMEGPSPASIMRNSVVVATGAYVLIKLQPVLALSPFVETTLIVVGAITAVGASWVALAQVDLKRAFSHSTSAYLGLVFIAVGLQNPQVAMLLLFSHALAKALLFMSLGSVIFTTSTQDVREMGGLAKKMPATTTAFVVAGLGLVGCAPLGSLWAMDALANILGDNFWLWAVLLLVNGLTAFNLARVFALVFGGDPQPKTRRAPEVPWPMAVSLVSLTVTTLCVPVMLYRWSPLGLPLRPTLLLIAAVGLVGAMAGYYFVQRKLAPPTLTGISWHGVQDFLAHDLYIEKLYSFTIVWVVQTGAKFTAWLDRNIFDATANLVGITSIMTGQLLRYTNSGQSQNYFLTIMGGVLVVMLIEIVSHWF
jgi:NAD(P)H-quinone oxidoreductase subunit 5